MVRSVAGRFHDKTHTDSMNLDLWVNPEVMAYTVIIPKNKTNTQMNLFSNFSGILWDFWISNMHLCNQFMEFSFGNDGSFHRNLFKSLFPSSYLKFLDRFNYAKYQMLFC